MDDPIIVCRRISELAVPNVPADRALCVGCGAPIWLGHQVQRDIPFARTLCYQCVEPLIPDAIVITPEVRRELRERGEL